MLPSSAARVVGLSDWWHAVQIIELLGNEWYSGELGPSTVVGSAAFNLFVISAVCIYAIPTGQQDEGSEQSGKLHSCKSSGSAHIR